MTPPRRTDGYAPIEDYAVIGNLRTTALVAIDGSIDWCCFPELDSPSVFGALLDADRGGRFQVAPAARFNCEQRYVGYTNVLRTVFTTDAGRIVVTDFMPLRGSIVGCEDPDTTPEIHRLVECEAGAVPVAIEWSPRFGYAERETSVHSSGTDAWVARSHDGTLHAALAGVPHGADTAIQAGSLGGVLRATVPMRAGERLALVMRYGSTEVAHGVEATCARLEETVATWRNWVAAGDDRSWAGDCAGEVIRSELVLKLLTHPRTGAIAAAATTSLPETIGGIRNWDYRFTWIRDAAFTVQALMAIGHRAEALDFLSWAERAAMTRSHDAWGLQIMYGLRGEADLPERELLHLSGYRNSRPVRVGNAAARQRQHDIYGELMGAAHQLVISGGVLEPDLLSFLSRVADQATVAWRAPDEGIWEVRREPRHYVYSKVMVWVALDRALRLARRTGLRGNVRRWMAEQELVHRQVVEQGIDPESGAFVQAYGSRSPDAANLLIPVLEFLPPDDPRVLRTLDFTLERLTHNGMVYRYLTDDGLPGHEGAFGLCTYWAVDAMALCGRVDQAWDIFSGMTKRANHVGLYSEEVDPVSGRFLGNFPQAFTHIGLINSVLYLARAEGRKPPRAPRPLGLRQEEATRPVD